jgi:ParB family chromosome partitioning protein
MKMSQEPRKGLGRGLSALINSENINALRNPNNIQELNNNAVFEIAIDEIYPNLSQPRKDFSQESLQELVNSIKEQGVIQPILVRKKDLGNGKKFEIIAGERRWRASMGAQSKTIPVIIKEYNDSNAFEIAIIENIQREQLNAIEEADAYKRLIEEYGYTQEKIAEKIGKSRSHITNLMRLLSLPNDIRDMLIAKKITMGHARAILASDTKEVILSKILAEGLSVRETEALVNQKNKHVQNIKKKNLSKIAEESHFPEDDDLAIIEQHVSQKLGMQVKIIDDNNIGKVIINFHNLKELDLVLRRLQGEA